MAKSKSVRALNSEPKSSTPNALSIEERGPKTEPPAPASGKVIEKTDASEPARPTGKLGMLIDYLAADGGATAAELAQATGWQRHTVLGGLSRLRSRGFTMRLDSVGDRKTYRLISPEALVNGRG